MNILGKRYIFFFFSLLLILPGLVIIALYGLPLSIDFKSGSLVELGFSMDKSPQASDIIAIYDQNNISEAQVQLSTDKQTLIAVIKSSSLTQDQYNSIIAALKSSFDPNLVERRFDTVAPSISKSVTNRAIEAVVVSSIAVLLYIAFAFRGIKHGFRYGICSTLALLHDILLVISLGAIGSKFFGWQIDSLYLTALLTVIGFSTQDTIVVFDRIRENEPILRKVPFETLVNHSIVQSLQRSINTQLMTSEFLLFALALFGGISLREMCIVLLVGLLSGTYSSIFIAAPILVVWENKEWKTWFRKSKPLQA
jgi:preprotein translocase subunit SecF